MATPVFAPMLIIPNGIADVNFYTKAFGAEELRRFSNDDGSIHVAEFSINGAIFHLHEQWETMLVSPERAGASTVSVNIFVDDVDAVVHNAVAAGAKVTSPVQDFDYGYRQGDIIDIFGHCWQIQKKYSTP
jgi:PhnB protein